MNIFCAILMGTIAIFILVLRRKFPSHESLTANDFIGYPTANAAIYDAISFSGNRWIVFFQDENGETVGGMDHISLGNLSASQKESLAGKTEPVYYWKRLNAARLTVNHIPVRYYIHFCDPKMYVPKGHKSIKDFLHYNFWPILFFFLAGIILLFGNG